MSISEMLREIKLMNRDLKIYSIVFLSLMLLGIVAIVIAVYYN